MKKNIRNSKYLFFILKNKLFEILAFCCPIRVGHTATHKGRGGRVYTHEKFTNNAYK